jgi:hypothetical protein
MAASRFGGGGMHGHFDDPELLRTTPQGVDENATCIRSGEWGRTQRDRDETSYFFKFKDFSAN